MMERLEHANLCVHDIDAVIRFLTTAFPDFRIRRDTTDADGSRWVHVGNDWEFVQYFSTVPAERHDYDTPGR